MSESEENANKEILNQPNNADLTEIAAIARDEERQAPVDAPENRLKYDLERLQLENKRLGDENEELKDVHALRKEYIPKLFYLTVGWLITVLVFVGLVARGFFVLSDKVLIALITSTTVSVIGIFMLAAKWLFPYRK